METRIALAVCLVLGCALCGKAAADAVRRRARVLSALSGDVRSLRIHMTGMLEPVQCALERSGSAILAAVAREMKDGRSAEEAWKIARPEVFRRGGPADALTDQDMRVLDALFECLGQTGREEQENLLGASAQALEALRDSARKHAGETDRLYISLGLLVGLMLALVVI